MMKDRKRLYDKAKRDQTPEAWRAYCNVRNKVTQAIENDHVVYQSQLFDTTVSKKFWKYIKGLYMQRSHRNCSLKS